ncbi:conserved hypothetical protein [Leishmania mexicana MHOM/GT/2001/U1103]|uniref:Uncharacterized protein n=1 Tax=Leishmania mexicana (strain MHOM/GT/2001/U1103) TaxID=929439 RepID=E9B315_LEIMU|nr:conserved hypothetical protein [Leishmania mexicana MHOM/GT/2001/U1103]CBZ29631.1 conserved hypothetical protein [Leishmania mexicana MHOM/GT/2001/U1103]
MIGSAHTIGIQRDEMQLRPPRQHEPANSATVAAPALASDAATPAAASAVSSAQGLARYFHGLAAGDEMAGLIRGLRSSMWQCYQDCLHRPAAAQVPTLSVLASGGASGLEASVDGSAALSSRIDDAPLRESSFADAGTQFTSPVNHGVGMSAAPLATAPATPAPIPPGKLKSVERRQYWSATKAAMLFAVESPSVAEEATALHCSAITRSLLYNYYYPSEGGDAASRSPRVSTTLGTAPAMSTLHRGEVRWVLSDTRVAELAREALKMDRCDGGVCGWQRALALLRQVDPSPLTSTVELELYRRTNGHHWAEALRCLWRIEPAHWTEMDVAAAVRCLYSAGRRYHQENSVSLSADEAARATTEGGERGSHASSSRFQARLKAEALRIHHAVEAAGVLRWSTSSTFNDTLGLVALDTAGWLDACALLDKLLAGAAAAACSGDMGVRKGATRGAVGVVRREKALHTVQRITGDEAVADSELFLVSTFYESEMLSHSDAKLVASHSPQRARSPELLYHLVRANAVTVHQTCRALRSRWDVGLRYVQLLQDAFADTLHLPSDTVATEDVLRLCIAGQQWEAALRLVTAHQAAMTDSDRLPAASEVAASKRATLPQHRKHYHADVFVQLVHLFGSVQASRSAAYDLIHRYAASSAALSAACVKVNRNSSTMLGLGLSKHYNMNTLSRAYNFLVQSADTLDAAEQVLEHLRRSRSPPLQGCSAAAHETKGHAGGGAGCPLRDTDAELAGLETESVTHIAYLSAVAGDWRRALHHANALLHEPRYRTTFFPTARLHDAVQYALEQAPSPGPSWQVSLQLFTDMMERNVPSSEVSFQSAVKRCFAGGVPDQAQRLFHFVLRNGVRP